MTENEEKTWNEYDAPKPKGATESARIITMTRREAIERMVLAMHNEDIRRSIKDLPCDYNHLADAALNALLPSQSKKDTLIIR